MLSSLTIRDIVLIERLDIRWQDGLNVLTGETGAGKSIILDALSLALGARGDGALVRQGAEHGSVTAVFDLPLNHPVRALLAENDIDDDGDIILKRIQRADGRTKSSINDQPVSVQLMRSVASFLVEIHGQHADRALVDTESHRALVDAYAGLGEDVAKVESLYHAWRATEKELTALRHKVEESENERDYLRAVIDELHTLSPELEEEQALAARRQDMMNVEKIAGDINEAYEAINGHASPVPNLASQLRRLERKADQVPGLLDDAIGSLSHALHHLEAVRVSLGEALQSTEYDPNELERVEERLFALRAAARKHKVQVDDLPALIVQFMNDLEAIESGEERLAILERQECAALAAFDEAANALSKARGDAASALANQVMSELPALKLEAARFLVALASDTKTPSPNGYDTIAFHVQTNPGTQPGPIMKVASGGELSRFLLALKVTLADRGSAPTLIFDEIDTGVGGAVAEAIGGRLKRLADRIQVLSVTHAPQVAACARHHYLIAKDAVEGEERVETGLRLLPKEGRREEIARMLAGETITKEARAAADQLLAGAG